MIYQKYSQTILETERLLLVKISPRDLIHIINELSEAEAKEFFAYDDEAYQKHRFMCEKGMETFSLSLLIFLLVDKQRMQAIGDCGFHSWNAKHRRAELFYGLRQDSDKQKGYMSEALPHIIRYGFENLALHRICAYVANWNTPSVRLIQKNKFTFEGTAREDYNVDGVNDSSDVYSLLIHEWKN